MAQTTHAANPKTLRPTIPTKSIFTNSSSSIISIKKLNNNAAATNPSIPPSNPLSSPFLTAFLTATPVATEIISRLSTPEKHSLFATCIALSEYRDSCYAWRSVTLTKSGYEARTSFSKINYQIQARINSQGKYISQLSDSELRERAKREGWVGVVPIESYFCSKLDSGKVWEFFSARQGFGSILQELVLDGTAVDIGFVKKVLAICAVGGKGLKTLSLRYCEKVVFGDIVELIPKDFVWGDDASDSGFESQSEDEEDSLIRGLKELRVSNIIDLNE
ncbi:hypothetical protein AA313_de0205311 [Arthrobotrys entomopaga]|nr:hypothetical protein AA313_de0205311 [Arthrobotrys entomopaga]